MDLAQQESNDTEVAVARSVRRRRLRVADAGERRGRGVRDAPAAVEAELRHAAFVIIPGHAFPRARSSVAIEIISALKITNVVHEALALRPIFSATV